MSNIFNLDLKDLLNGLITAVIGGALMALYNVVVTGGTLDIDWNNVLVMSIGAGIAYLIKRYGSNDKGEFLR